MTTIKQAFLLSFATKYGSLIVQLVSTYILARILSPEEYGLFAICLIFVMLAELLREFGVGNYLIKEKTLNRDKISSAYGLLLVTAAIFSIAFYSSSFVISDFYQDYRLQPMLQLLTLNIVLAPFGSIIEAFHRRNLNFLPSLSSNLIGQFIGSILIIHLALNGWGEFSLVWGSICTTAVRILVLQFFRTKEIPVFPSLGYVPRIFKHSKFVVGTALVGLLGQNIIELVTGKFYSVEAVGLLNRAASTSLLFNRFVLAAINPVITPYVSKMHRDKEDITGPFLLITNIQVNLAWPFFIALGILSDSVIYVLFGSQWLDASIYLTIYCITRIAYSSVQHVKPVLLGLGVARVLMYSELSLNVIAIMSVLLSIDTGVLGMLLISSFVSMISRFSAYIYLMRKHLSVPLQLYFRELSGPIFCAALTVLPIIIYRISDFYCHQNILALVSVCFVSLLVWLLAMFRQPSGKLIYNKLFKSESN